MKKRQKRKQVQKESKFQKRKIRYAFLLLLVFINLLLYFGISWIISNVGLVSIGEIIFHIHVPLKGTSHEMIFSVIKTCIIPTIILFIGFVFLTRIKEKSDFVLSFKIWKKQMKLNAKTALEVIFVLININILINHLIYLNQKFHIIDYLKIELQTSTFIEENYVDPKDINITLKEKRNLIYIYLESVETTYMDKEHGGNQETNLMPGLTELAQNNTNFSNTDNLGGFLQLDGTGWTIAAMISQSSGAPLKMSMNSEKYVGYKEYMPGLYNLGDVLKENGYHQMLMVGSESSFAGRDTFYKSHGDYEIKDLESAKKDKIVDDDYFVFWGMEDSHLFDYAKQEIKKLSQEGTPFNFTTLTVNTHFPDGYVEDGCETPYKDSYQNAILCSSNQVSEFVSWIQEQEFYKNTTIVIVGDHLTMANDKIIADNNYQRTVFNAIVNPAISPQNNKNREFSSFDMYPTILASLGAEIEGNKLGLGVNLYSTEPTIIEKYGFEKVNEELKKRSVFYNKELLYKTK